MGGGGPANKTRGFFLEADPAVLALSLKAPEGEELRREKDGASCLWSESRLKRASSARGERSDKGYSLGFLRIGGLVEYNPVLKDELDAMSRCTCTIQATPDKLTIRLCGLQNGKQRKKTGVNKFN